MHLNTKLMKAQYRGQHDHVVGHTSHQVKRQGEVNVKKARTDWLGKLAGFFGIKLTTESKTLRQWMETVTKEKHKRGGSKLGYKLFKTKVRAIAKVQRKQQLGIRVSLSDLARTGMPVRLRDVKAGAS